jgi:hypothetical protein
MMYMYVPIIWVMMSVDGVRQLFINIYDNAEELTGLSVETW